MKKLIVTSIVATMVMGLAVAASAFDTDWQIYMKATDNAGANYLSMQYQYGQTSTANANDAIAGSEDGANPAGTGTNKAGFGCFTIGNGAAGTGYSKDIRTSKNVSEKWTLKLWLQGSNTSATGIKFYAWNPATYALDTSSKVKLTVVGDPTGTNLGNTVTFDSANMRTSSAVLWTFTNLGTIKASGAAPDEGKFVTMELETIVPEPGSMVAMLSGLVGLAGFGLRRKK